MSEAQRLNDTISQVYEELRKYLEDAPHDISTLYSDEELSELAISIAEGKRDDIGDQKMEEARDDK